MADENASKMATPTGCPLGGLRPTTSPQTTLSRVLACPPGVSGLACMRVPHWSYKELTHSRTPVSFPPQYRQCQRTPSLLPLESLSLLRGHHRGG